MVHKHVREWKSKAYEHTVSRMTVSQAGGGFGINVLSEDTLCMQLSMSFVGRSGYEGRDGDGM